jgi:hypothetical protein
VIRAVILGLLGVILASAGAAHAGGDWRSNHFVNPNRSVRCLFDPYDGNGTISCASLKSGHEVTLASNGTRGQITPPPVLLQPYWRITYPVLRYGQTWHANNKILSCFSARRGMTCRTVYHLHGKTISRGFFINRWRVRVW